MCSVLFWSLRLCDKNLGSDGILEPLKAKHQTGLKHDTIQFDATKFYHIIPSDSDWQQTDFGLASGSTDVEMNFFSLLRLIEKTLYYLWRSFIWQCSAAWPKKSLWWDTDARFEHINVWYCVKTLSSVVSMSLWNFFSFTKTTEWTDIVGSEELRLLQQR